MIVPLLLPIIAAAVSKGFAAAECLSNEQICRSAFCSAARRLYSAVARGAYGLGRTGWAVIIAPGRSAAHMRQRAAEAFYQHRQQYNRQNQPAAWKCNGSRRAALRGSPLAAAAHQYQESHLH